MVSAAGSVLVEDSMEEQAVRFCERLTADLVTYRLVNSPEDLSCKRHHLFHSCHLDPILLVMVRLPIVASRFPASDVKRARRIIVGAFLQVMKRLQCRPILFMFRRRHSWDSRTTQQYCRWCLLSTQSLHLSSLDHFFGDGLSLRSHHVLPHDFLYKKVIVPVLQSWCCLERDKRVHKCTVRIVGGCVVSTVSFDCDHMIAPLIFLLKNKRAVDPDSL